jgi:hypothetical protein
MGDERQRDLGSAVRFSPMDPLSATTMPLAVGISFRAGATSPWVAEVTRAHLPAPLLQQRHPIQ